MKAHQQLEITLNSRQSGYRNNSLQIMNWITGVMPSVIKKQKMVTEKMSSKTLSTIVSLCLS